MTFLHSRSLWAALVALSLTQSAVAQETEGGGGRDTRMRIADTNDETPPDVEESLPENGAQVADEETSSEVPPTESAVNGEAPSDPPPLLSDEQVRVENEYEEPEGRPSTDPFEEPSETYMFLGAFYRHNWTPGFMLSLFLDEYTATNNSAFGLEFTYRKDGFDIVTSLYYQRYAVNGPFRGPGDAETETEIIDSSLFGLMASVDLLWGTDFNKYVGIQYGLGLGLGVLLGDLHRTEARRNSDSEPWEACTMPDGTAFCDDVSGDIQGVTGINPKWFSGGSVPNLYMRLAVPVVALRIKPIHQMMMRVSGGFDIFSGFFASFSASYGF